MSNSYTPPPPGLPAGARVWAYLRDSGGPSQEQSVDQQEREIVEYCKQHRLVLVQIFRDVARSGGSVIGRAEFLSMIDLSEDETVRPRAILIWNFARFARNLRESQFYKSQLRLLGIIIHSITDQIPSDDHIGELVENVTDWMNEEKRRQISRDVKRGLKDLVRRGYSPGIPPRGYVAVKVTIGEKRDGMPRIVSKWELDPVLAEPARLAWQLRAQGKSYQEITAATKGQLYTSGGSWNTFFRNKAYLGVGKCGELEVPDHHEPLTTWEIWEAVQRTFEGYPARKTKGHPNHPRRVGNPSILSGFTYCVECGAMMTHSPGNRKRPWLHYLCGSRDRRGPTACKSRRVGAARAEREILAAVLSQVLSPDRLLQVIEETRKGLDSTPELERQIRAARRQLEKLEISIRRNLDTIERTGSHAAQDLLMQREAEKAQTQAELEQLTLQLATARTEITPAAMVIIMDAWRAQLERLEESGNVRAVKAWLMQFVSKIELGYNQARIFYTYPLVDLLPDGTRARNASLRRGGTVIIRGERSILVEWSKQP